MQFCEAHSFPRGLQSQLTAAHSCVYVSVRGFPCDQYDYTFSQPKTPASPSTSSMCRPISTICCLSFSRYSAQQTRKSYVYYSSLHFSSLILLSTVCPQNAMRATVETHETSPTLPPIKVRVSLGSEDLTIKVDADTES